MLEKALSMGLSKREYETIVDVLGREPTDLELGVFALNWSEHCSYKSSKRFLRRLPSESERTVKGPGGGAGVIDLDGETVVAFKIESHNHPSAVEPKHGAATGVGGIVRDVLSVGVRPVALLDTLRFGDFRRSRKSLRLLKGVVEGIAWYGNSIGVPVVGGEVFVSSTYEDNPLVNVMCVGIGEKKHLKDGVLKGTGNSVLIVGAPTGRDGIMGASFASQTFEGDVSEHRPAVQIGDPFMEKLLIEATLEAVKLPQVLGMQDLGAGGLSTALPEMARNGGVGVELWTDRVPTRHPLTPYEVVLSESQERMVLCVERGKEDDVINIYRKWGLEAEVIGRVIEQKVFRIMSNGDVLAEIPLGVIFSALPLPEWIAEPSKLSLEEFLNIVSRISEDYRTSRGRRRRRLGAIMQIYGFSTFPVGDQKGISWADEQIKGLSLKVQRETMLRGRREEGEEKARKIENYYNFLKRLAVSKREPEDLLAERYVKDVALKVLSHPNVASKRWIYRQYDHMVGTDTVLLPGEGDAAVLRIKGKNYAVATTVDGNGKYLAMDPYWGTIKVCTEVLFNITAVGGKLLGLTDGVNFPSPEHPDVYYSLQTALRALGDFAEFFKVPVVSGNVSLYNETEGRRIFPTLMVGGVGLVKDPYSIPRMGFTREGLHIYSVGFPASVFDLAGSEFLSVLLGEFDLSGIDENTLFRYYRKPEPFNYDLSYLKDFADALYDMINLGMVLGVHDVSEGGTFSALAEMLINGEAGAQVRVEGFGEMFSETIPKVIITTNLPREVETYLSGRNIPFERIGRTVSDPVLDIGYAKGKSLLFLREELEKAYYGTYESVDAGSIA